MHTLEIVQRLGQQHSHLSRQTTPLDGITVWDETGTEQVLDILWTKRPVLLAFVRHFG